MADLSKVPDVDIDPSGVFKYILIKVSAASGESKFVVRGYSRCDYHADIYDEFRGTLNAGNDLKTKCVGGGRINHEPQLNKLLVYGYSQGFGKADHAKSVAILETAYPNYDITFSNEGY